MWPWTLLSHRRRVGVLEIRHEDAGAGVERVDDHLAIHGTGDLDAPVDDVGLHGRARPVGVADRLRFRQEFRKPAGVELGLARRAAREELGATAAEGALQTGREGDRLRREDLRVIGGDPAGDLDAGAKSRRAHQCALAIREGKISRAPGEPSATIMTLRINMRF